MNKNIVIRFMKVLPKIFVFISVLFSVSAVYAQAEGVGDVKLDKTRPITVGDDIQLRMKNFSIDEMSVSLAFDVLLTRKAVPSSHSLVLKPVFRHDTTIVSMPALCIDGERYEKAVKNRLYPFKSGGERRYIRTIANRNRVQVINYDNYISRRGVSEDECNDYEIRLDIYRFDGKDCYLIRSILLERYYYLFNKSACGRSKQTSSDVASTNAASSNYKSSSYSSNTEQPANRPLYVSGNRQESRNDERFNGGYNSNLYESCVLNSVYLSANDKSSLDRLIKDADNYDRVRNIDSIAVYSYSPIDGTYDFNMNDAKNRGDQIKNYIESRYSLMNIPVKVNAIGEDWDGLTKYIESSDMVGKSDILNIIRNVGIFNGREKRLMDYRGGLSYIEMKNKFFQQLRRVEVRVYYRNR